MAKFKAFGSFDITKLELNWYVDNFRSEDASTKNWKFDGKTYADTLVVTGVYENTAQDIYNEYYLSFAGGSIDGGVEKQTIKGTINFMSETYLYQGEVYDWWYVSGVSFSAKSLLAAAKTIDRSDEVSLFRSELSGNDSIYLSTGDDRMSGFAGQDRIYGYGGADLLSGGTGRDHLYGGTGADDFIFDDRESGNTSSTRDVIYDFAKGSDDLDLRLIDANSKTSADNKFDFGGTKAGAHDVWYAKSGNNIIVFGDTNGDARADFQIELRGVSSLTAGDFLL